ncbi:GPP34 family phosphoprotein [Saccharopolyspora hirsuta]|uniref:GPP34 family phosphoprotein n=1 Tax=Saccharopolyspora hirsuta TaxID=1837 RepID=UPI0033233C65
MRKPVIDRLLERGLIRSEERRVLGLFRTTRLPAEDTGHEAELRRKMRAALEEPRRPHRGAGEVQKRAEEFEEGNWGAEAVSTAVVRTPAAIAESAAVVTVITACAAARRSPAAVGRVRGLRPRPERCGAVPSPPG